MNKQKHIVVLGAGYGGILTAKKLAKKFKKKDQVKITLIDKKSYHTMLTELHEVAAGRVPEDAIRIDLKKIFAGRNVDVVLDEIIDIKFDEQKLQGKTETYEYDYLVLGTGSKPTFFGCPGAEEYTFTLWSYEDAVRIKNHINDMMDKASNEKDLKKRQAYLTFTVIGCGFTGIEMIGELAEWRNRLCKTYMIDPEEVNLYVIDMLPKVLPNFKDKLIRKTEKRLKKLGVQVLTNSGVTEVQSDKVIINGKDSITTNTVIWAAGIEGSDIIDNSDIEKKGRNRVETDSKLRVKGYDNVFVVGDNIFYIPEGEDYPVPQMVENAEHSAALVAKNVNASVVGNELEDYKPHFHGAMVCIGGRYGVAQVGTDKMQLAFSGFIALFIKHFINVIYFLQVAGFNKIWTYMMHEIFHVPDRRSLLGGHFSKRSPNFWLVPLRLFLGVSWLLEGLDKLPKILEDPRGIFLIPAKVMGDATAAATQVVESDALPVPEFIENIVQWSMDLMFYTADGKFTSLASIFQILMVVGEIVVGLCLIGGLFTAVASIASIGMTLMIWSSGMASTEMLWYMFGGVATIGGSGSTLGLDYYALPFMKKIWKKIPFVKKWYLYTE